MDTIYLNKYNTDNDKLEKDNKKYLDKLEKDNKKSLDKLEKNNKKIKDKLEKDNKKSLDKLEKNNLDINNDNLNTDNSDINKKSYIDLINISDYEINDLPLGINISTMCASCKLNTKLNILSIENYLKINSNDILTKKISNDKIETLLPIKKKKKRQNNLIEVTENKNYFYNQITIIIRIFEGPYVNLDKEPRINMKLFKNGSIQMSGCKSVNNINIALNKIINKLKDSQYTEFPFLENIETLNVSHFKMDMINSNYRINMQIDRTKLYELLTKKKIRSTYEQCIKACVIIKIPNINNKDISIFIFQKGNIIINSAKSKEQIINSYNYINNILYTHKDDIIKKDEQLENEIIFKYFNEIMADVKCGLIQLDTNHTLNRHESLSRKSKSKLLQYNEMIFNNIIYDNGSVADDKNIIIHKNKNVIIHENKNSTDNENTTTTYQNIKQEKYQEQYQNKKQEKYQEQYQNF